MGTSGTLTGTDPALAAEKAAVEAWPARPLGSAASGPLVARFEAWAAAAPKDARAQVALAQVLYWHGLQLSDDAAPEARQLEAFTRGLAAAQRATELDGKNPVGPFWDAVNRAKQAELRGIVASASELPTLEKRMNRVDVLQQCYFHGGVWRYWAAVIARTPTWLVRVQGRSIKDGEDAVRKSLACEPAFVGTYRFWAELRVKDDDAAGARVLLKKGLELPESNNPEVAAWNRHERMLCRRMLATL